MSILKKYLTGFTLAVVFDETISDSSTVKVNVDYALNYHSNLKKNKHDVVFDSPKIEEGTVSFELPTYASALLIIDIIIDNIVYTTLFLNQHMLYKALKQTFNCKGCCTNFNGMCQDCNEKSWRTKMITILLRMQLLQYAYTNAMFDECIQYFIDLYRLLCFECITFESIDKSDDTLFPDKPDEEPEDPDDNTPSTPTNPVFYIGTINSLTNPDITDMSEITADHIINNLKTLTYGKYSKYEVTTELGDILTIALPVGKTAYLDQNGTDTLFASTFGFAANGEHVVNIYGTMYYVYGQLIIVSGTNTALINIK